ncbi:MAG: phenylacetate--CoA ligase family protein [Candidatus Hodarchaeota archaeon]
MANLFRILYYLYQSQKRAYWPPDELRKYQEQKLRSVVKYAYNFVPFYHDQLKKLGITPNDIQTLEDLTKLPVVQKETIRHLDPSHLVSSQKNIQDLKIVRTSGSSGTPFLIYIDGVEDDWRKSVYMRANILCGQKPRDRWVVITAPHHFGDTTQIQRILGMYAQKVVSIFMDVDEQVDFIVKAKADILDGYSSSLTVIAKHVDREGISGISPKLTFGNAEIIDLPSRKYLEDVFDTIYCDQYGCAELDRTAWQCPERIGYHMDVDSVITELVDEDGSPVGVGERGEVVFTSLFNYSMPFLRYAVGDVAVALSEKCSCGVTFPLMEKIEGRTDAFPILPDGTLISPLIFTAAMMRYQFFDKIRNYRIIQKKRDLFLIYVEKEADQITDSLLSKSLTSYLKDKIGVPSMDIEFQVKFVDTIPKDKTGKLKSVYSEINQ